MVIKMTPDPQVADVLETCDTQSREGGGSKAAVYVLDAALESNTFYGWKWT